MSNFNTLYHGEAGEAADALDHLAEPGSSSHRAALTNALRRIARLEAQMATIHIIQAPAAICPDCGTEAIEEAIGQVCGTCGRGMIEAGA
jgi:hypothetical protein